MYTPVIYLGLSFYINLLLGKCRKPTGEQRIFMFLDIKSSTTLAERLGLKNCYALLNDFLPGQIWGLARF